MNSILKMARIAAAVVFGAMVASGTTFRVDQADVASWTRILHSIGIAEAAQDADIIVAGPKSELDVATLSERHFVIVEGLGQAAKSAGISAKADHVSVRQICDVHGPKVQIIWQQAVGMPEAAVPGNFEVFAKEKWNGVPVLAGKRTAHGAILWLATEPGAQGSERYPYVPQAMADLGLSMPARATNLWAFFDSAYRVRADSDYLARRWRQAGVSVLHVAAWHNIEPDAARDEYLKRLIEACHRNAILVYAWLELPHVSDKFWADHPGWREKTAIGQDAALDWRKLMNLQNPECRAEAAREVHAMMQRFDWDGVNLAELYFESLEGAANPARFTPMNDDIRREFQKRDGFDPKLLFEPQSAVAAAGHPEALRKFLDYRAQLAGRMQADWLDVLGADKQTKPYLDLVVTQIDDQFEPGIRDDLGADTTLSLRAIREHQGTLLVEDPATLWNLGPQRYSKIANAYTRMTTAGDRLAVDINVVERYQDVYPTKKQTGVELLELVHEAAGAFGNVALYFENSLEKQDLALLPVAASLASVEERGAGAVVVKTPSVVRVRTQGPVEMDGKAWPLESGDSVLVPAGSHILKTAAAEPAIKIADFNGGVRSAMSSVGEAELAYMSATRAIAVLDTPVSLIEVDGASYWKPEGREGTESGAESVILPAGQHVVTFHR